MNNAIDLGIIYEIMKLGITNEYNYEQTEDEQQLNENEHENDEQQGGGMFSMPNLIKTGVILFRPLRKLITPKSINKFGCNLRDNYSSNNQNLKLTPQTTFKANRFSP